MNIYRLIPRCTPYNNNNNNNVIFEEESEKWEALNLTLQY